MVAFWARVDYHQFFRCDERMLRPEGLDGYSRANSGAMQKALLA
jgi:hypothetical protein